jgi:hypothetical protein
LNFAIIPERFLTREARKFQSAALRKVAGEVGMISDKTMEISPVVG